MAKDKGGDTEGLGEGEGEGEGGGKKGGVKGLVIKIVPLVLIALVVAKMTVLKPPPPSAAQVRAKAATTKYELDTKCALANGMPAPAAPPGAETAKKPSTPPTTAPPPAGPVLELDSKTVNLDGSHFLKIGLSLQLPAKAVPDTIKTTENWGSLASQLALDTFSGRSFSELSNDALRLRLQHQIGQEVCIRTEGKVVTTYFIDFVMQ